MENKGHPKLILKKFIKHTTRRHNISLKTSTIFFLFVFMDIQFSRHFFRRQFRQQTALHVHYCTCYIIPVGKYRLTWCSRKQACQTVTHCILHGEVGNTEDVCRPINECMSRDGAACIIYIYTYIYIIYAVVIVGLLGFIFRRVI